MLNYAQLYASNTHRSGGFTLIELMIVIAIVAILVAVAVPAYQDFTVRAKVAECMMGAAPAKLGISEYRIIVGKWLPDSNSASLTNDGSFSNFCDGFINYDPVVGSFQIDIDETAVGGLGGALQPQLTPEENNVHTIVWRCSRGMTAPAMAKYLPSTCKD